MITSQQTPTVREIPDMHRYCEEMGQPPFNWNAFLAQEEYAAAELETAQSLAMSWVTCACGNQCAAIPRLEEGHPVDKYLRSLGAKFGGIISGMRSANDAPSSTSLLECYRAEAKRVLTAIELRSAALIAQLKANN